MTAELLTWLALFLVCYGLPMTPLLAGRCIK